MAKKTRQQVIHVAVFKEADGWAWSQTDARGKTTIGSGGSRYGRKHDAIRGAQRANAGKTVKIAIGLT